MSRMHLMLGMIAHVVGGVDIPFRMPGLGISSALAVHVVTHVVCML
jgi:hypothetical protein